MTISAPDLASFFTFPDGDLDIIVEHEGVRAIGKVNSAAMCLSSPVWRKFIHPPFGRLGSATSEPSEADNRGSTNDTAKNDVFRELETDEKVGSGESIMVAASGDDEKALMSGKAQHSDVSQLDFHDDDSIALLYLLRIAHVQFVNIPSTLTYHTLLSVAILVDQYDCVELIQPWVKSWLANEETECLKKGQEHWLFIAWTLGREKVFQNLAEKLVRSLEPIGSGRLSNCPMPPQIIGILP